MVRAFFVLFATSLPTLAKSDQDRADLATLRYVIEVGAVESAVHNATDEQIARLGKLARPIGEAARKPKGLVEERQADPAFHTALLEITGSPLIAGLQRVPAEFFRTVNNCRPAAAGCAERVAREHSAPVEAVRDRDVESVRGRVRSALNRYLPRVSTERNGS